MTHYIGNSHFGNDAVAARVCIALVVRIGAMERPER